MTAFYKSFGFFQDDIGDFSMSFSRFIKSGRNNFCIHMTLHIGNFFRPFIDKQDDQVSFRMIICNGIGNFLQDNGFTGFWLCNDQSSLSFTDRGEHIDDPGSNACIRDNQ